MTPEELDAFADVVDATLADAWPRPGASADAAQRLWQVAADHGWTELASAGAIDGAVLAMSRIGRRACNFALTDVFVAGQVLAGEPTLATELTSGRLRPVVLAGVDDVATAGCVDAAEAATHALLLFDDHAELRRIDDRRPTPGLAQPDWHEIDLGALDARITTSPATTARHRLVLRLGLVARAVGAARRTWQLALDHAKQRVAFGHRIGSFQAVSHRAVDGATELTAAELLIAEAAAALIAERPDTLLAVELAVEFARNAASTVQFGAQYTLAATGYFDEHDAPWLFRRVHADLARLDHYAPPEGAIADVLLRGADLPVLDLGADAEAFRLEIREFLRPFALQASVTGFGQAPSDEYLRSAVERGYVTMAWPVEFGGRDATVEQQIVMAEELAYYRLPLMAKTAADLLGTAVIRHGTPDQQKRVLPLIAAGELPFYLGYSEPEVGSDLANLRTVAVRDGDDWIVNGRKMWGTGADTAQWVWLAARTAPTASSPQAGITVFLTRVDRPGWESQHHRALSGEMSSSTFFDDYRVPDGDRVGEINGGWAVISEALAHERVVMANIAATLRRLLDDILAEIRAQPPLMRDGGDFSGRAELSRLAARLQAARVLVNAGVRATAVTGGGGRLEAPMAKVLSSLLMEDFCVVSQRMLGSASVLGEHCPDALAGGAIEYTLRLSIMQVVGGGTVDIQRNLIARALGLPRN